MYGDPDVLRSRVDDLREQAVDVRSMAEHLVAQTDGIGWSGRAADAMRLRVAERAGHLRAAAAQHDVAADSLETHVHELESLQDAIAAIERRVGDLTAEARTRAARRTTDGALDGSVAPLDPAADSDAALLTLDPPPPGHRDWLDIEVPGL
ncbi:hypothetical protein BH09ACT12_BH09ACT12_05100 [soil metagenome]